VARVCRECRRPVRWGIKRCPHCGEENPTGANPGDVVLVTGLVSIVTFLAYALSQGAFRGLFRQLF
jgi:hypothetical protein